MNAEGVRMMLEKNMIECTVLRTSKNKELSEIFLNDKFK